MAMQSIKLVVVGDGKWLLQALLWCLRDFFFLTSNFLPFALLGAVGMYPRCVWCYVCEVSHAVWRTIIQLCQLGNTFFPVVGLFFPIVFVLVQRGFADRVCLYCVRCNTWILLWRRCFPGSCCFYVLCWYLMFVWGV
jgi:hypothetical protein